MIKIPDPRHKTGRNRAVFPVGILVLLLFVAGTALADDVPDASATTPERTGASIYFETSPPGATIWLDNVNIGTSPFTYFSPRTGTMKVRVSKKNFQDYTEVITVGDGERVDFKALLAPVQSETGVAETPAFVVTTATIIDRGPVITVPTPWPTETPESPVSPVIAASALALAIVVGALFRR
jgi:hypothetical protein